jgi:hypothetical protein
MALRHSAVIFRGSINVGCLGSESAQILIGAVECEPMAQESKDPVHCRVTMVEVDPGAVKFTAQPRFRQIRSFTGVQLGNAERDAKTYLCHPVQACSEHWLPLPGPTVIRRATAKTRGDDDSAKLISWRSWESLAAARLCAATYLLALLRKHQGAHTPRLKINAHRGFSCCKKRPLCVALIESETAWTQIASVPD